MGNLHCELLKYYCITIYKDLKMLICWLVKTILHSKNQKVHFMGVEQHETDYTKIQMLSHHNFVGMCVPTDVPALTGMWDVYTIRYTSPNWNDPDSTPKDEVNLIHMRLKTLIWTVGLFHTLDIGLAIISILKDFTTLISMKWVKDHFFCLVKHFNWRTMEINP